MLEKFIKNHKGLTLIEVILSITILSIILLSFMSFFTLSSKFSSQNESKLQGVNLARHYLEKQLTSNQIKLQNPLVSCPSSQKEIPSAVAYCYYEKNSNFDIYIYVPNTISYSTDYVNFYTIHSKVYKDGKKLSETYAYFHETK
jgi:prepilin-type N-terminal cleavage/methylation domain-containing protein